MFNFHNIVKSWFILAGNIDTYTYMASIKAPFHIDHGAEMEINTKERQKTTGGKSPVGAYKRVEALTVFSCFFKTILIVSLRRDEMLT